MKVDQNENAYPYRITVDDRKRSKTHQNENDDLNIVGARVQRTSQRAIIVFERFSVEGRKRIKAVVWIK